MSRVVSPFENPFDRLSDRTQDCESKGIRVRAPSGGALFPRYCWCLALGQAWFICLSQLTRARKQTVACGVKRLSLVKPGKLVGWSDRHVVTLYFALINNRNESLSFNVLKHQSYRQCKNTSEFKIRLRQNLRKKSQHDNF